MSEIEIQWLGHSCYQIRKDGYTIVTDPYRDGEVPGYRPLRTEGDRILSSHGHADHNAVECVTLTGSGRECPWEITKIHSWHDEEGGSLRGDNTIFVLEDDSYRIAFMGDFGCDLPEEDMAIHKTLATFVDKDFREKAKPENCYTKKQGQYLMEWDLVFAPFFKRDYEDKSFFFDLNENMKKSRFAMSLYASHAIAKILGIY